MKLHLRLITVIGFLISACGSNPDLSGSRDWPSEILEEGTLLGASVGGKGEQLTLVASNASSEIVKGGLFDLAINSTCVGFLKGTRRIRIVFEDSRLFAPGIVSTATVIIDPKLPYFGPCSDATDAWRARYSEAIAGRLGISFSDTQPSIRSTASISECDFDADFRKSIGDDLSQHCRALLWEYEVDTGSAAGTRALSRIVVEGPAGPRLVSVVLTETD